MPHRLLTHAPAFALALGLTTLGFTSTAQAQPSWYTPPDSTGEVTEQGQNRPAHRSGAPIVVVKSEEGVVGGGAFCGQGADYPPIPGYRSVTAGYTNSSPPTASTCFFPAGPLEVSPQSTETELNWNAAKLYCMTLTANGENDWYLPSRMELLEMYAMHVNGDLSVGDPASYHWSATERNSTNAWYRRFSDGGELSYNKTDQYQVRCVRR